MSHPPFLFGGPPLTHEQVVGVASAAFGALNMAASFVVVRYCSRTEHSVVLGMWYAFTPSNSVVHTVYTCCTTCPRHSLHLQLLLVLPNAPASLSL